MKQQTASQYEKMINTDVAPLIARLCVPSILTMLVTNIYNLADTAFVGQLGTSASGAVGVVFGFMTMIQAIGFVFGQGAGSIIARLLGQQENEKATVTASTGFFFSFGFGVLLSIVSWLLLDPLVMLLGSTPTIASYAKIYISYILAATPFMSASFTMNQILRYEGKAALGMIGMMTGGILNIIGDPILMFVFKMGIAGAGLSTALSQMAGFCILLGIYIRGKSVCRITWRKVSFDRKQILDILATGLPSLLRQGLNSVTTMVLNGQAAVYGDAAIAAMSIVNRIIHFIFSIALGIGHGFQPVSGFNYGAGRYSRVRKAFRVTVIMAETFVSVSVVFLIIWSGSLIGLFRDDPDVIAIGTRALRVQGLSLLLLPMSMATEMLYQSTGQKLGASVLSLLRGGLIFIPSILILARLRGLHGIEEAQAVAFAGAFLPSILFMWRLFRKMPEKDTAADPPN
ncbi:MATE family efflux transporter [Lachnoclostridium pacaense]|uniref:MATE family efflux transporter n=1 Tax=Enterocloster hominis (ex Hitch et al. 2024) TaxID=1917870 RepID=UPI001D0FE7A6|nr:MATE family efflux transporter [Lachnoclostridium pacaense]MCC2877136.1 MATE family efflux transporter [Lachnoclostridium pacaense]